MSSPPKRRSSISQTKAVLDQRFTPQELLARGGYDLDRTKPTRELSKVAFPPTGTDNGDAILSGRRGGRGQKPSYPFCVAGESPQPNARRGGYGRNARGRTTGPQQSGRWTARPLPPASQQRGSRQNSRPSTPASQQGGSRQNTRRPTPASQQGGNSQNVRPPTTGPQQGGSRQNTQRPTPASQQGGNGQRPALTTSGTQQGRNGQNSMLTIPGTQQAGSGQNPALTTPASTTPGTQQGRSAPKPALTMPGTQPSGSGQNPASTTPGTQQGGSAPKPASATPSQLDATPRLSTVPSLPPTPRQSPRALGKTPGGSKRPHSPREEPPPKRRASRVSSSNNEDVQIYVGEDRTGEPFIVNRSLLFEYSPHFERVFEDVENPLFVSAVNPVVLYTDTTHDIFHLFVQYINWKGKRNPNNDEPRLSVTDLCKVWVLAGKISTLQIQNGIMREMCYQFGQLPVAGIVYVYKSTLAESPLRRVTVNKAIRGNSSSQLTEMIQDHFDVLPKAFLADMVIEQKELLEVDGTVAECRAEDYYVWSEG